MTEQYPQENEPVIEQAPTEAPTPPPLSEQEIVSQIRERFIAGITDSNDRRETWRTNWRAFNNDYDDPKALPWQSDVVLPRVSRMCQSLAGGIKDAATRGTSDWFTISEQSPLGELVAPIQQALVRANLEHCKFSQTIESAVISGLLTCAPAYIVIPDTEPWPGYSKIELVDMRTLIRDPSGRDEWVIQASVMPYAKAKADGKEKGWNLEALETAKNAGGVLDPSIAAFIQDVSRTNQPGTVDRVAKTVVIEEYWGPLYDTEGEAVHPFAYVVTCNRQQMVYGPADDPTQDGENPYCQKDLMPAVFDSYAKSYVEDGRPIAHLLNSLVRAMTDGLSYSVMRAFLIRPDSIGTDSVKDLQENGLQPGSMVLWVKGTEPPVQPLDTGVFPPEALPMFQVFCQEWEEATGVTRLSQGLPNSPGSPSDKTLGQTQIRASAASRGLDALTASFEDNTLTEIVRKQVRHNQLYCRLDHPMVDSIAHEEIESAVNKAAEMMRDEAEDQMRASLPPDLQQEFDQIQEMAGAQGGEAPGEEQKVERGTPEWDQALAFVQEAMKEPMNVRVSGLTGVVEKDQKQALMGAWVQQSMALPGGPQLIDTPAIMKTSAHGAGFDPEDAMIEDADKAWLMGMAEMMAQEMATQAVQGMQDQSQQEEQGKQADHGRAMEMEQMKGQQRKSEMKMKAKAAPRVKK